MLHLLLAAVLTSSPVPVDVITMNGREVVGDLTAIEKSGVKITTSMGVITLPRGDLLRVSGRPLIKPRPTPPQRQVLVELVDGSLLVAAAYSAKDRRSELELETGDRVRFATRSVRTVRLKPQEAALDGQWQAIANSPFAGDLVVLRKTARSGESGNLRPAQAVLDQVEGILGEVDQDRIAFVYDGAEITISRSKVEGLIYYHPQARRLPEPLCEVQDHAGSRWMARSVSLTEGVLAIITPAGVRHQLPLGQLAEIDYSAGNLDYLDALTIESSEYRPLVLSPRTPDTVTSWFRPRPFNESQSHLTNECKRGLTLHSWSHLTYRLQREYRRLKATVGIDERFRERGQVRLLIEGNDRVLFDQEVRGGDAPVEVDVSMQGVRRLSILVDFGQDGSDQGDHLNICNARLTK